MFADGFAGLDIQLWIDTFEMWIRYAFQNNVAPTGPGFLYHPMVAFVGVTIFGYVLWIARDTIGILFGGRLRVGQSVASEVGGSVCSICGRVMEFDEQLGTWICRCWGKDDSQVARSDWNADVVDEVEVARWHKN